MISIVDSQPLITEETPELVHILKDAEWLLWKQIHALPEKQRLAMTLFSMDDLSYQEIAAAMNISVSAIESLLFRARTQLKKYKPYES
jgi:RNA polymerase sigma-70 factor (ECF subfamily)